MAKSTPQGQVAGGGLPGFTAGGYNPWGPTVKGDPNYNLTGASTGGTGGGDQGAFVG